MTGALHDHDRAWKGFDWHTLGRLHAKGMIGNPVGKTKSVLFTEDGLRRSKTLLRTNSFGAQGGWLQGLPPEGLGSPCGMSSGLRYCVPAGLSLPASPSLGGG